MQSDNQASHISMKEIWAGRVMSALPVLMLLFSAGMKVMKPAGCGIDEEFTRLGYSGSVVLGLGVVEIMCTALYLVPRTCVLGAILLTGYLGGATATHVRVGDPGFFFPIVLGVLIWGGLFMRDPRVRALIPLRSCSECPGKIEKE